MIWCFYARDGFGGGHFFPECNKDLPRADGQKTVLNRPTVIPTSPTRHDYFEVNNFRYTVVDSYVDDILKDSIPTVVLDGGHP